MTAPKTILFQFFLVTLLIVTAPGNGYGKEVYSTALTDTVVSGTVKDNTGKPIANAKVSSSVSGVFFTDINGRFTVMLTKDMIVPQSFIFTFDTLAQVVRSYHPVMAGTHYDIVLEPKRCCLCDLWIERLAVAIDLPSLTYKTGISKLSPEDKLLLKNIELILKENPDMKIVATAYPSNNEAKETVSDKRLLLIKEYLIEQLGISSDRITTEKKPGEGSGNVIDFKKQ